MPGARLRVLVTHERFLPEYAGGCEYGVYQMARGLASRGAAVRVLTTGDPRQTEYRGIETERMPVHRYRMNLMARRIARAASGADLIQTSNYHACLASCAAGHRVGKPVVLLVTALCAGAWAEMKGAVAGRAYAAFERFLMRRPFSRIVFPSAHSMQVGLGMGIPRERCVMIAPGIDHEKFRPGVKDGSVLFVGKFEARKGIGDLMETARALPDVRFRAIGWGEGEAAVRRLAPANVAVEVLAPGAVMREGADGPLARAFGSASIFFMPSRAESFGLVVAEAMASGCAVVSTVPVEFEGVRVVAGDVPGMASAIRELSAAPEAAEELGKRNARLAHGYCWERFTTSLMEVYYEVLAERGQLDACHV